MRTNHLLMILSALLILLSPLSGQAVTQTIQINNPAYPQQGVEEIHLEEVWSIDHDDQQYFFGIITCVIADRLGNTYLLDGQLSQVQVVDPEGYPYNTISREGDGPGETRFPLSILDLGEDEIGIVQPIPGKIIRMSLDNLPRGVIHLELGHSKVAITDAKFGGGYFLASGTHHDQERFRQRLFIARFDLQGQMIKEYWGYSAGPDLLEVLSQFRFFNPYTIDDQGYVYIAPDWNKYRIEIYDQQNHLIRVITRDYPARRRNEADRRRAMVRTIGVADPKELSEEDQQILVSRGLQIKIEDYDRVVLGLWLDEQAYLWVRTSQGDNNQSSGVVCTYDVFDPQGHFIKQVELHGSINPLYDRIFFLGHSLQRLVVIQNTEEETYSPKVGQRITCYRILK